MLAASTLGAVLTALLARGRHGGLAVCLGMATVILLEVQAPAFLHSVDAMLATLPEGAGQGGHTAVSCSIWP